MLAMKTHRHAKGSNKAFRSDCLKALNKRRLFPFNPQKKQFLSTWCHENVALGVNEGGFFAPYILFLCLYSFPYPSFSLYAIRFAGEREEREGERGEREGERGEREKEKKRERGERCCSCCGFCELPLRPSSWYTPYIRSEMRLKWMQHPATKKSKKAEKLQKQQQLQKNSSSICTVFLWSSLPPS